MDTLDLLGREDKEKRKPTPQRFEMHRPQKEGEGGKKKAASAKATASQGKQVSEMQEKRIDLSGGFQRRRKIIRITVAIIAVLAIIGGVGYGAYRLVTRPQPVPTPPIAQPEPIPEPEPEPTPEPPSTGELPNTPLTPLRGALVTFPGSQDVFLVEENGELRMVIKENVVFDNGQTFNQLRQTLIYQLPARWAGTRRGSEDVTGQVDFDPRVVSFSELLPFIQTE